MVSSLGRVAPLESLLDSLSHQSDRSFRLALCVQGNEQAVRGLLERKGWARSPQLVVTKSELGLSRGRNLAVDSLGDSVDYLLFPNDTSILPPSLLGDLSRELAGRSAAALTVVDNHGPKFVLPAPGTPLDRNNVWRVIAPGLVMRRDVFAELLGFDESLGTGASTPWQSGEETDLLLRFL